MDNAGDDGDDGVNALLSLINYLILNYTVNTEVIGNVFISCFSSS